VKSSVENINNKSMIKNVVVVKFLNHRRVESVLNLDDNLIKWTDIKDVNSNDGTFTRFRGSHGFIYIKGKLDHIEDYYNFADYVETNKEQLYNNKIGSLDFETMTHSAQHSI